VLLTRSFDRYCGISDDIKREPMVLTEEEVTTSSLSNNLDYEYWSKPSPIGVVGGLTGIDLSDPRQLSEFARCVVRNFDLDC